MGELAQNNRQFVDAVLYRYRSSIAGTHTRKLAQLPEQARIEAWNLLHHVGRILTQKTRDKNKLYALHALEAECIYKVQGQNALRAWYQGQHCHHLERRAGGRLPEHAGQFPYDGHTLDETIEQVEIFADKRPCTAIVDKYYRGVQVQGGRSSDQASVGASP